MPHKRLILKLDNYGIRGSTLDWIQDFLSNRSQTVVCEGTKSPPAAVVSGVPQGTVLGPLLFLAYINDMPGTVKSTIRLFADDALVYRNINSIEDSAELQKDLNELQQWEAEWQMEFNPDKCEVLRLTQKKKNIINYNYSIHGQTLQTVEEAKYLGVTLDSKLSFNPHIEKICKKANHTRAFVHRNTKNCPRHIKVAAYNTLVRPQLEYCSTVWSPHTSSNIDKIQAIQRRAARSIMNDWTYRRSDSHYDPGTTAGSPTAMQKHLKWVPLEERRAKAKVMMFYKIIKNLIDIPSNLLQPNTRDTRHHNKKYYVVTVNTLAYQHSFFPSATNLWNDLSPRLVVAPSLESLRHSLANSTLIKDCKY